MNRDKTSQIIDISALEKREMAELRQLYQHHLGQKPPIKASRNFLTGNLSWVIQAKARKQNPVTLRNQLNKRSYPENRKLTDQFQSGTILVREWHGVTYEVTTTDKGYQWQGQLYRSLTAIAREITGANWSGPRFFGLRANQSAKQSVTNS